MGSAPPGARLGGARAGRTSSAESLVPPTQGCASAGVTNPGPLPCLIAQWQRQEPKCHLPQPRGASQRGDMWVQELADGTLGVPSRRYPPQGQFPLHPDQENEAQPCPAAGPSPAPAFQAWARKRPLECKPCWAGAVALPDLSVPWLGARRGALSWEGSHLRCPFAPAAAARQGRGCS